MQNRSKRGQSGFTMLELVTVVAILMILMGFAVINTRTSSQNAKANAAAASVVSQMRAARELAIAMRRNVLVTFTAPNQIQMAVQTLPGEAAAAVIPPVYLNDNAPGGAQFYVFAGLPDTPMGFGNSASSGINFQATSGGTSGLSVLFNSSGSLVGTTATTGFASVGSTNPINASIFIGFAGQPNTARAITVLGTTGRVRSYYWAGPATSSVVTYWQE
jgi:prepilin-type N-terminal cleavage/methylation domain-containing protein